jgi:hypothetical protein
MTTTPRIIHGRLAGFVLLLFACVSPAWTGNTKVEICHIPKKNPSAAHTIVVSENALRAHLKHGDTEGACEPEGLDYIVDEQSMVTVPIDSDGGEISIEDFIGTSYHLVVPPDAVTEVMEITITNILSVGNAPPGFTPKAAVLLGPSGSTFPFAPILTIELPATARTGFPAIGFVTNDEGTDLSLVPLMGTSAEAAALTDTTVFFSIPHFSGAGIAEVDDPNALPEVPVGANAETRANHAIARRMAEVQGLNDDPVIAAALGDWSNNEIDGWITRALELAQNPDPTNLEPLRTMIAEISRWLQAAQFYLQLEIGPLDIIEFRILIDAYLDANVARCDQNTRDAQAAFQQIKQLRQELGFESLGDDAFTFQCKFEIQFNPDMQVLEPGETGEINYGVQLQDGTPFNEPLANLVGLIGNTVSDGALFPDAQIDQLWGKITAVLLGSFDAQPDLNRSMRVRALNGPTDTAEGLVDVAFLKDLPELSGLYNVAVSGTQSICEDPDDEGLGGGQQPIFLLQSVESADTENATLQLRGNGGVFTDFSLRIVLGDLFSDTVPTIVFVTGTADYLFEEQEIDDDGNVVTFTSVGSGSLLGGGQLVPTDVAGTRFVDATFDLEFIGSDNFCNLVTGSVDLTPN